MCIRDRYKKYKLAAGKTAKSILISCGARLAVFDIAEPVSYTHLDVYKRQLIIMAFICEVICS